MLKVAQSIALAISLSALFTSCAPDERRSRSESAELADTDEDVCASYGWYDDGICDRFCLQPDGDCASCPDPSDPAVHYQAGSELEPLNCEGLEVECETNQEAFSDGCGCGCIDQPEASCPDPQDPAVHYAGNSDEDPSACAAILFQCDADQQMFYDQCGCGCIDQP